MQRRKWDTNSLVQNTLGEVRAYIQRKEWYAAKVYKLELEPVEWVIHQIRNSQVHVLQNLRSMYVRKIAAEAAIGGRRWPTTLE